MTDQLQHIADVQFGVSTKTSEKGSVVCFQVSNLNENNGLNTESLFYIEDESEFDHNDLLKGKDILLPAKGTKLTAVLMPDDFESLATASSSLFVIRISSRKILPEYLQWFLNLPQTQWNLERVMTGTNISSLSIKELRKVEIQIPELDTQRKIISLKDLQEKEAQIMYALSNKRKILIEAVTKKIIA